MLEITISAILVFIVVSLLLIGYTILDIHDQLIPNQFILLGALIGITVAILSGHFLNHIILHITTFLFMAIVGYALFQIGSFGGADVKIILILSIVSPGLEFTSWENPIFEAILIAGIQLAIMLGGGYVYSKIRKQNENTGPVPLIPFLLLSYMLLQLLAFF